MLSRALDLVLAALALLGPFAIHLFFPVIPVIKVDFQLTDALAQLAFSIGVFGMAFSTLAYGAFADRYGRRPVLLIGLSLFLLGSMISALAGSFIILLIGRLVQSIGAGCGITLARAIARDVYGAERLIKAIAYLTMFFAIGGLLAPGVGGVLVDQFGWRSVFAFAGITGLAIAEPDRDWFDHVLRLSPPFSSTPVLRSRHPHRLHHRHVPDRRDGIVHIDEGAAAPARH